MTKHRFKYPLNKSCVNCGKGFTVINGAENRNITCSKMCGDKVAAKKRSGSNHPGWKGGRKLDHGYIEVLMPEHPKATKQGYVREHRLVMEKKIGRYLKRTEVVHHINGNKKDNRIENLEICLGHSGHAKKHSEESSKRMTKNMTGRTPWNKGKKLPPPYNYSGLLIKCINCGKEKHYPPSTIAKGKGKFCSQGCAFDHRYKRT